MSDFSAVTVGLGRRCNDLLRSASTPLTVAAFALCAGTGIVLLCERHLHAAKVLHDWSGIALLVAVALHLLKHWRALKAQFARWPIWLALGGTAVVALLLLLIGPDRPWGSRAKGGGQHSGWHRSD